MPDHSWSRPPARRRRLGFVAAVLVAGACGSGATPATTQAAATSAPNTTPAQPPTTTTTQPPTVTSLTPTTAATSTTVAPATTAAPESPAILVAGPEGIALVDKQPLVLPPDETELGEWVDAIPDGAGGLVYAGVGQDAQVIWWWPAAAAEPQLISFKPGRALHDAAVINGRPTAIVVDDPDPSPETEPEGFVQLITLEDGTTTTVRMVAGIEFGPSQVSYGDGVFLVTEVNDGCGALYAFDRSGNDVDLAGLPEPPCEIHFEVPYSGAAFGPADTGFAYVEQRTIPSEEPGGTISGAELVVVGSDGAEQRRIALNTGDELLGRVSFDGRWAIVEGGYDFDLEGRSQPVLVDTETGTVTRPDITGSRAVRLAASPVELG